MLHLMYCVVNIRLLTLKTATRKRPTPTVDTIAGVKRYTHNCNTSFKNTQNCIITHLDCAPLNSHLGSSKCSFFYIHAKETSQDCNNVFFFFFFVIFRGSWPILPWAVFAAEITQPPSPPTWRRRQISTRPTLLPTPPRLTRLPPTPPIPAAYPTSSLPSPLSLSHKETPATSHPTTESLGGGGLPSCLWW